MNRQVLELMGCLNRAIVDLAQANNYLGNSDYEKAAKNVSSALKHTKKYLDNCTEALNPKR